MTVRDAKQGSRRSRDATVGVRSESRGNDSRGSPRRGSHPTAAPREDPAPPLGARVTLKGPVEHAGRKHAAGAVIDVAAPQKAWLQARGLIDTTPAAKKPAASTPKEG